MPDRHPRARRPAARALNRSASRWERGMVLLAGWLLLADALLSTIWGGR